MSALNWFGLFDTAQPLEQGVILFDFEYLDVVSVNEAVLSRTANPDKVTNDVIILTQSCDLVDENAQQHIHVCPIFTLKKAFLQLGHNSNESKRKFFESMQKQRRMDKFLTNKCNIKTFGPKYSDEYLVVAFDMATVVSSDHVRSFSKKMKNRLILKSPYREALAQAYGRYFMRIGNPINIENLNLANYPGD